MCEIFSKMNFCHPKLSQVGFQWHKSVSKSGVGVGVGVGGGGDDNKICLHYVLNFECHSMEGYTPQKKKKKKKNITLCTISPFCFV